MSFRSGTNITPGWANVMTYGAKGDNSTNDTTAIQNAINAAANGVVYFPVGNYVTTTTLTVTGSPLLLGPGLSNGTGAVIRYAPAGTGTDAILWTGTGGNIDGLGIVQSNAQGTTNGLHVRACSLNTFQNLYVKSFTGNGYYLEATVAGKTNDNRLSHSFFTNNNISIAVKGDTADATDCDGNFFDTVTSQTNTTNAVSVTDKANSLMFVNCGFRIRPTEGAITLVSLDGTLSQQIGSQFVNCHIEGQTNGTGFVLVNAVGIIILSRVNALTTQITADANSSYLMESMGTAGGNTFKQSIKGRMGFFEVAQALSGNTTLTATDHIILASGTITLTLPASANVGQRLIVRNVGAGTITLTPASGNIDAGATKTLATGVHGCEIISDGTNWWSLSSV